MTTLSKDSQLIKERIIDLIGKCEIFPYSSPLGSLHAAGIKDGEEIALKGLLKFIEEMEEK